MNIWMIALIALGLLAVAGVVIANATSVMAEEPKIVSCSSCGNSCSADSNCRLKTCGAINGGSCNCGK
ncbi:MAG TPA: hypothetical protein VJ438_00040 [Candidatus Nanoarchaeia archaeon]|nr:hypothetical protein [Candidatus Nanoarchaeia archaeon]